MQFNDEKETRSAVINHVTLFFELPKVFEKVFVSTYFSEDAQLIHFTNGSHADVRWMLNIHSKLKLSESL